MKAVIIGCGRMGARHVLALQELKVEISGIFDVALENMEQMVNQNNLSRNIIYKDVDLLFSKVKPDLCIIATTLPSHKEYILKAVQSGTKKILCEKPLSGSLQDCLEIIKLCNVNKVDLAVNHQMRFMDQYCIPKEMLYSEDFGGLESISVTAGNFGMAMNGSHYFEMMRFMFDDNPCRVSAWFDKEDLPNPRGKQFFDKSGCVRLCTNSGKKFYIDASSSNGHGMIVVYVAKYGQIIVDELAGQMFCTYRKAEERKRPSSCYGQPHITKSIPIKPVDVVDATKRVIHSLIVGIGYPSAYDAMIAISVLVGAYVSNENNHIEVDIANNKLPLERQFAWA